ncbi:class I SAM-dependent methyltransferase [Natronosporangium hydrolyticum]|uniref:Class I SAM-dependent methyltransferase n=1 Tax=Natronosporangium hydrolyticum TaxID=2811111 RepID=A0A895YLM4_9ACTN|nr:class I SAM-dependent methyltransferase [Natronosporangium hydrolyticum]QSB15576.1 class I SAM-dependent methyltransferase [Natronosporangium hydrolyticum]
MTPDQLATLRTPAGQAALATAASAGDDPLAAAATLRRHGIAADLAAAALTQARLRRRAAAKWGPAAAELYFTQTGLEQSTRAVVARRRAHRLAAAGVRRLVDLGCGIGADSLAAAAAGIDVVAVDADPLTAAVAEANAAALGLADRVTVRCTTAESPAVTAELATADAVFCDPARRRAGTGRRTFDPAAYSPPWSFVATLPDLVPRTVLKLAPGIDHALLPAAAEAEWVSVGGDLVEATVWCGPLAVVPRRATLLAPDGTPRGELTGDGAHDAPVGPVRRYLYDPDPAVLRTHLVAEFAATVDGTLADDQIGYVYTDQPVETPYARGLEVHQVLPFSLKRLRTALREADIGQVEIMKRGTALVPDQVRRELRLRGTGAATVVLTRVADAHTALICRPLR